MAKASTKTDISIQLLITLVLLSFDEEPLINSLESNVQTQLSNPPLWFVMLVAV